MFSDLVTYTTPKFQRAHMVLVLLQLALKKAGYRDEAQRLEGLDLTNPAMAHVALEILKAMNIPVSGLRQTHEMAVEAIHYALHTNQVQAQPHN